MVKTLIYAYAYDRRYYALAFFDRLTHFDISVDAFYRIRKDTKLGSFRLALR